MEKDVYAPRMDVSEHSQCQLIYPIGRRVTQRPFQYCDNMYLRPWVRCARPWTEGWQPWVQNTGPWMQKERTSMSSGNFHMQYNPPLYQNVRQPRSFFQNSIQEPQGLAMRLYEQNTSPLVQGGRQWIQNLQPRMWIAQFNTREMPSIHDPIQLPNNRRPLQYAVPKSYIPQQGNAPLRHNRFERHPQMTYRRRQQKRWIRHVKHVQMQGNTTNRSMLDVEKKI